MRETDADLSVPEKDAFAEIAETSWLPLQEAIMRTKKANGFNTTDIPLELALLQKEISEFFDAWRFGDTKAEGPELADIAIFLLSLAQMRGVDLGIEVVRKMRVNSVRQYTAVGDAAWVKD